MRQSKKSVSNLFQPPSSHIIFLPTDLFRVRSQRQQVGVTGKTQLDIETISFHLRPQRVACQTRGHQTSPGAGI